MITAASAVTEATFGLAQVPESEKEQGRGELNQAASWDDFPNGRFGDFKSPAYGNLGPWGSLGFQQPSETDWGNPSSIEELTTIFLNHLHSKIDTTPFSPGALSPESLLILPHLEKLTRRGWWTVGSQPAIDGANSSDPVVGWGPKAGYVFQKSFVEFFCEEADVERLERAALLKGDGMVHWFAGTHRV